MLAPCLERRRNAARAASLSVIEVTLPRCRRCGAMVTTELRLGLGVRRHQCGACQQHFASVETTVVELRGTHLSPPRWSPWMRTEGLDSDTTTWASEVLADYEARRVCARVEHSLAQHVEPRDDDLAALREIGLANGWAAP